MRYEKSQGMHLENMYKLQTRKHFHSLCLVGWQCTNSYFKDTNQAYL